MLALLVARTPTASTTRAATAAASPAATGLRRPQRKARSARRRAAGNDRLVAQEAIQVVGQLLGRRIRAARDASPGTSGDRFEIARNGGIQPRERRRVLVGHLTEDTSATLAAWNGGRPVSSA